MAYIQRLIHASFKKILDHQKSILLLGPRQVGKTTLVEQLIKTDLSYSFLDLQTRRRLEEDPSLLIAEIKGFKRINNMNRPPLVFIDEIQKVPQIMDTLQLAIDQKLAIFILTGSSLRKLRRQKSDVNLLPGRVIELHLSALSLLEMNDLEGSNIEDLLLNGTLPEVLLQKDAEYREWLLSSYVNIYLEEEVRAEAALQNLASFSRFLSFAALDAGRQLNVSNLAKEIGVSRNTIESYYQILTDCLIVDRLEPLTHTVTRRRLMKAPKYLFFDLGIRRIAAKEGLQLPKRYFGDLFEQFIGMEILKLIKIFAPQAKCYYWRDHAGPEVDYVIEYNRQYLPIEVKWSTTPTKRDAKHLMTFMKEYGCIGPGYIVSQTPKTMEINPDILAVNWRDISSIVRDFLTPR